MNNLPDPVQWSEGMLISPQHFQQNDIWWQQHLRHRLQAITPHYWGVRHMRCNLIKEVVSISELECILPDGLAVQFPGNFPRQPAGNLELDISEITTGRGPVKVWLWVYERSTTAASSENKERRFDSVHGPLVADENTGEANIAIERLQVRFQLYLGTSTPSDDCACPLLEVERNTQGLLVISAYHPPMLQLSTGDFQGTNSLHRRLDSLNERLWAKVKELSGNPGDSPTGQVPNPGKESREHLDVARHLASCLPQLTIELAADNHPRALYRALAQVVGQVASIGENPTPLHMKPYQHDDCLPQFQAAIDFIESKLATVNTTYKCLPFEKLVDSSFALRLFADTHDQFIVELKPRNTQTGEQLKRWINAAMIASEHLMPQLLRTRLQGAMVRPLSAREIENNNFHPHASFFLIKSQNITTADNGEQPAFSPDQLLLIRGEANADMPAEIIMYRRRQKAAPVSHA